MNLQPFILGCFQFLTLVSLNAAIIPGSQNIVFSKITRTEGLSHNNVECIFKSSDGFVWFGTRNGLCRFDGYNIEIYRSNPNLNSLSGDRILCINEDKQGNLWIGTYGNGLDKFNKITGTFTHYLTDNRINQIEVFKNGDIWACTNNGLVRYKTGTDTVKIYHMEGQRPHSINSNYVHDILETTKGEIFIATESYSLQKFNPITEEFFNVEYKRDQELTNNYRKRIIEDRNGTLWIAANIHGLCSYNPETGESEIFLKKNNQLTTNVLTGDMSIDEKGKIWICTDGGGINIFDPNTKQFQYLRHQDNNPSSLSSDHVYCVYFDNLNITWIGTFNEGVNYYNPRRYKFNSFFRHPGDLNFLSQKSIISLFQDQTNRLWIGTDGEGLYMLSPSGEIKNFRNNPDNYNSVSSNAITSLGEDTRGNLLIGTYSGGLTVFNVETGKFKQYKEHSPGQSNIGSDNVWQILTDSKKRTWLGLLGNGADRYDPVEKMFEHYGPSSNRPDKVDFPNIMAILEDSDGDIWFGSEGKGLYVLDSETNKIYRIKPDLQHNMTTNGIVKCLYQDRWGNIWIGTEGKGLYKLDKKSNKINNYTVENGLPSNIIQSVIEDAHEKLWIGTSLGLCLFDPKNITFRNFIQTDGLSGNEFNRNAIVRLNDGRLAFGTTNGLDIFNPADIQINQNLPHIAFTKLEIMNIEVHPGDTLNNRVILKKSINYAKNLVLTSKEKIFSLEFAALNYTLPNKCMYKYMLSGFDENWYTTGSDMRKVSYSNLSPGDYTFKLKASNNDGKWGNNERTLQIRILPPFYRTWFFRIMLILITISVVIVIYRYRLNVLKSRFRRKQVEQERKIIELQKEKLESELQNLTFYIINRNRVLIDQKNRLLGLSFKAKESVKHGLQDIINTIDEELSDDKDWKYVEPQLDKVYNNFVSRLKEKHPDLNLSEIKIAAYVRMNLSNKEMSEFMHKTIRAIENDRYRLRKKIGLDSNDSLQHYLINL
jgi:ligand-binding sensor domain-containing protein/DNA-binding CsgD family transcriptional regulator